MDSAVIALVVAVATLFALAGLFVVRHHSTRRPAIGTISETIALLCGCALVYGLVALGFVYAVEHREVLANLPVVVKGMTAGVVLAASVRGGMWVAGNLTLWGTRRPMELPAFGVGVKWAAGQLVAFACLFGAIAVLSEQVDDAAAFGWSMATFVFYSLLFLSENVVVPWFVYLRAPRLHDLADRESLQLWADGAMRGHGRRPIAIRIQRGGLANAFVWWGIRRPWLVVGQRLVSILSTEELRAVIAHELAHVLRRDTGRLVLWGLAGAGAMTVAVRYAVVPLFASDQIVLGLGVIALTNTVILLTLGAFMRRMEYATDRLAVELLDGDVDGYLASALTSMTEHKGKSIEQSNLTHPSVAKRIDAMQGVPS